ncbi:hypothetical protein, partial [Streptomyces sp. NPDC001155]
MSEHRRRTSGRTGPSGTDGIPHGGRAEARRAARAGSPQSMFGFSQRSGPLFWGGTDFPLLPE